MTGTATELLAERTLGTLLRRYEGAGTPLACHPVPQGLLNRGYRLATTRGRFFLKHYVAPDTADAAVIARQHRATLLLDGLGLPVAAPVADTEGRTVAVVGGRCYALYPWVEGRHREGTELTAAQSRRLGALLGHVHAGLARVQPCRRRTGSRTPAPTPGGRTRSSTNCWTSPTRTSRARPSTSWPSTGCWNAAPCWNGTPTAGRPPRTGPPRGGCTATSTR